MICTKKLHSLILTHFHDGSHLEFCHLDSTTAILDSDTLLSSLWFTQNTLTPLWHWLRLIPSDSSLFILTQLEDGSHLEFCHPGFNHLSFSLKLTHICTDWFPPFPPQKSSLSIPSPPLAQKNLHSLILTQLDDGSHLEFCNVGFRHLDFFSQIHSKTLSLILTLSRTNSIWLKLIHSHSNLRIAAILNSLILNFAILDSAILVFFLSNALTLAKIGSHHLHTNKIFSHALGSLPFAQKNFNHWFWLIFMMAANLNSAMLDSATAILDVRHLDDLLSDSLKNTLTPLWHWLRLIQSNSNLFILTQLEDGSHLEFCHHEFCYLGFSHLSVLLWNSLTFAKIGCHHFHNKNFTLVILSSTWLMAAILNSAMDEVYYLGFSNLRISSQTHSAVRARLVPTICTTNTSLTLRIPTGGTKKLHSFILTELDDGSHLEFWKSWFLQ